MNISKHKITLRKIELSYYTIGSGQPVLFLHGGRVEARTFKKNIEFLARDFYVIAPDIPGYGASSMPNKIWSFNNYAEFFDLFLKELKLKNVFLIGYSLGGIALYLAKRSKAINKVIFIDPAGLTNTNGKFFLSDAKRFLFYLSNPQYISSLFILLKDYMKYLVKHSLTMKQMLAIRKKSGLVGYRQQASIKIPTLILWGKDDWVFPKEYGIRLHKHIPNSVLDIVEGNHDWIVYNPKLFTEKTLSFLSVKKSRP